MKTKTLDVYYTYIGHFWLQMFLQNSSLQTHLNKGEKIIY